ncbi:SDR family NAD(P)-dependent oxidoreductase [Neolewinella lacunae]|uniref:SDR family NAD(P)-dependent oxidoreductase n=1 Tax=Neolewinella lacunae TaxID=1517758 RepID=A0A923TCT6_9BACT|nr:SDR family NAD(P)-dependent oxidoreductase [Neolewinella lacunae]MBC6994092.1 SDR family NAD(P)-dependent oxidoreductase [Neolewinella lacunae]MDN3636759.1 SDR family NAD(P)-dependent oxidoreductase [Neolewinella lacunae]
MLYSNQKVLITGGGSGIGLSLAKKFLTHNNTVIITGRNLSKLEKVKAEFPGIHIFQSDVTQEDEVKQLAAAVQKVFGGIDVLINNAGIMLLLDTGNENNDLQKQMEEIEINFHSPIRMLHHFLPQLKKSKNGVLVNVSSGLAFVPFAQSPVYSGTKAAVHFWTKSIRPQLKPYKIKVVELLPPVVDTKLAADADLKDDNLNPMPPERLADIFWKDYTNGKEEITPGISKTLKIMSRLAPAFIFKQLNKQAIPNK